MIKQNLYCRFCYDSLMSFYIDGHRPRHSNPDRTPEAHHIFLIEWLPLQSQMFDQLVYRLKSDNSVPALWFYADLMADLIQSKVKTTDFAALVPIAGSRASSVHAHLLAERLSLHFGLPVLDVISKKATEKAQKYMNAEERRQTNLFSLKTERYVEFTKIQKRKSQSKPKFLLIDDILTTGVSFQQCSDVLHGSEQNMIATLFYRPRADVRPFKS